MSSEYGLFSRAVLVPMYQQSRGVRFGPFFMQGCARA